MLFTSLVFLYLFLPFTLLFFLLILPKLRKPLLLLASLVFYAWGGVSYVAILIVYILFNYLLGLLIGKETSLTTRKCWLVTGIIMNLAGLIVFKFTVFFESNILVSVFGLDPSHVHNIILPIGISVFALKGISYLVTIYRRETLPSRNIIDLGLYMGFFPSLIAGPVDRYKDIASQLENPYPTMDLFASGVRRFALGLAKKVIIATPLASVANEIFSAAPPTMNSPLAWLGLISFMLQVYYEFSGYADMAVGLGRMFGFRLAENFDFPYSAKSLTDFWNSWNITLNSWFREYLYLALLSADKRVRLASGPHESGAGAGFSLLLTMILMGSWYGAGWNTMLWGLILGLFIILERTGFKRLLDKSPWAMGHFYTLFFLALAWVIFRSADMKHALQFYRLLFGIEGAKPEIGRVLGFFNTAFLFSFIVAILGCTRIFELIRRKAESLASAGNNDSVPVAYHLYRISTLILVIAALVYSGMTILSQPLQSFIFFRF